MLDVTRKASLRNALQWLNEVQEYENLHMLYVLAGNKAVLEER